MCTHKNPWKTTFMLVCAFCVCELNRAWKVTSTSTLCCNTWPCQSHVVTPGSYLVSLDWLHKPTLVFFYTFFYLCEPSKNLLVGHPSSNCSRTSNLNLEVLWRWVFWRKKSQLTNISILSILLNSGSHSCTNMEAVAMGVPMLGTGKNALFCIF
jgi:hypothetical protein